MAFNGTGTFVRIYNWAVDASNSILIRSDRMDTEMDGFATGLSNCITRDGQGPAGANIAWGGFKITNLGVGVAATDSVNYGQVFTSPSFASPTFTGVVIGAGATSISVPTVAAGDSTTNAASTAFVNVSYAPKANPTLTGSVNIPTPTTGDNTTLAASTAFVTSSIAVATISAATSTSTTSLLIGTGSKAFTTQTGKPYVAGFQYISLLSNANNANYMIGTLTSYNSATGAMVINVPSNGVGGAGTFTDWNISVSSAPGATGTSAATTQQTLTDAATINWNWTLGRIGVVTLAGNRTVAAPTNLVIDTIILQVIQDATGSRTLTWNAIYKFSGGIAPTLSTIAGRIDIFSGYYDGTSVHLNLVSQGSR